MRIVRRILSECPAQARDQDPDSIPRKPPIGVFFGVQAMFGFPIKDLIRSDITDQVKVVIKSEGTCVVIGSDQHPRAIPDCQYQIGDTLIITYKQGMAAVEKYQLKN
ncbi:MAG: hypothetical protein WAZ77_21425 [Candidatus Nitrosopolaris sp.]